MTARVSEDFVVTLNDLTFVGHDLRRPECVRCNTFGEIYASDSRGGIQLISPDGSQQLLGDMAPGKQLTPNGIALCRDGTFLVADIAQGGIYQIDRDGRTSAYLRSVDGIDLPPTNFVVTDKQDRTWITVSTRLEPRTRAYRPQFGDGFLVLVDKRGARIVADNLRYTNEVAIDATGSFLYVSETCGKRLSRFSISPNNDLERRKTITEFGYGTFPDGLALDSDGGVWITSIISNRVIRVNKDGSQQLILEDLDTDYVAHFESLFQRGAVVRHDVDGVKSRCLRNISSIAFGGRDLTTAYLGCLLGDAIASFRVPVSGLTMAHWTYRATKPLR